MNLFFETYGLPSIEFTILIMDHGGNVIQRNALAVITARGGSKRIPRKNIKSFSGQPIIKYSIDAAMHVERFDEVMVSTDDEEIAKIATLYGAKVPFLRSSEKSDDYATTAEVLEEVLLEYQKRGTAFTHLFCIYPTAPFVTAGKLYDAMKLLVETGADSVLPVTRFSFPIQRSLNIEEGRIRMNWPEYYQSRSQDLLPAYHDAGQFYALKSCSLLEQKRLYTDFTVPIIVPESEVQDIDNEEDWKIAELKFQLFQERLKRR